MNTDKVIVHDKQFRLYMPESEILARVQRIADQMSADLKDKDPILCPVLTGSFVFFSDLVRFLDFDPQISFVRYSSYSGTHTTGHVTPVLGFSEKCRGRDVVIVEDIVDTGITMDYMLAELRKLQPASIRVCTFFFKPGSFQKDFHIDYIGKDIPNDFILGYGLDYDGLGRTYRDIYVLDEQ